MPLKNFLIYEIHIEMIDVENYPYNTETHNSSLESWAIYIYFSFQC